MVHLQTSPLLLLHHTAFPQLLEKNPHRSQGPAVHIPWSPVLALKVPLTALLTSKNCTPEAALSERMHFLWRANIVLQTELLWDSSCPDPAWSRCPKLTDHYPSRGRAALQQQHSNGHLQRGVQLKATKLRCLGLS